MEEARPNQPKGQLYVNLANGRRMAFVTLNLTLPLIGGLAAVFRQGSIKVVIVASALAFVLGNTCLWLTFRRAERRGPMGRGYLLLVSAVFAALAIEQFIYKPEENIGKISSALGAVTFLASWLLSRGRVT